MKSDGVALFAGQMGLDPVADVGRPAAVGPGAWWRFIAILPQRRSAEWSGRAESYARARLTAHPRVKTASLCIRSATDRRPAGRPSRPRGGRRGRGRNDHYRRGVLCREWGNPYRRRGHRPYSRLRLRCHRGCIWGCGRDGSSRRPSQSVWGWCRLRNGDLKIGLFRQLCNWFEVEYGSFP